MAETKEQREHQMKISKELYKELESAILSVFTLDTIPDQIYQENIKYTQAGYSERIG